MSSISDYKARVNGTAKSNLINNTKQLLATSFTSSPSYAEITLNNSSTPVGVQIVDDSAIKEQKILSTLDSTYSFGDIVHWNDEIWLTLIVDDMAGIYKRGTIKRCISSLKWMDEYGAIKEAPFAVASDNQSIGLHEDKVMKLPSERRYLVVQNNADTLKIKKTQRFIFDRDRCWQVTGINTMASGLITFEFEETLISEDKDNVSLRIADYFIHEYSIHIANGSSVNLSENDTLQLDVVTKDNGTISSLPITYSSSDNSIATISESGVITAIANGVATITTSLTNAPTTSTTLNVNISEVVQSGWTLDIHGNDYCKVNQLQRFSGTVKNNGVTDTTKLIRWTLYDDSGEQPTTLATIITQSGSEVVIKANREYTGHIRIKGTCYANNNLTVEDIATYTVADLSLLTVDELVSVGFNSQNAQQYAVQNVDSLFSLGLTIEQMASMTVEDLAAYTVGDLADQSVLVSATKRVQIRSLI